MNARVAQYGFVVMFAAAFPLAPLIAFVMEFIVRKADIDRFDCIVHLGSLLSLEKN